MTTFATRLPSLGGGPPSLALCRWRIGGRLEVEAFWVNRASRASSIEGGCALQDAHSQGSGANLQLVSPGLLEGVGDQVHRSRCSLLLPREPISITKHRGDQQKSTGRRQPHAADPRDHIPTEEQQLTMPARGDISVPRGGFFDRTNQN
jgi:hypothetical protein